MSHDVPVAWQYAILAGIAFGVTIVGLWLYNRREKRRKHAIELMKLMNQWGLMWFAEVFEDYAVGDYSGLVHKVKEIVTAIRSDEAIVAKLGEVARKVAAYYAANDATKAGELVAILQNGAALKALASKAASTTAAVVMPAA